LNIAHKWASGDCGSGQAHFQFETYLRSKEKEKHSGRLYEVFAQWKPVSNCDVHCQQVVDDVTRWLREKAYTFEWLEDASGFPAIYWLAPENGSSFPGTTSVKDS